MMNQTYWSDIHHVFRPKYIDLVQSVQSYLVYRYPATSAPSSVRGRVGRGGWLGVGEAKFAEGVDVR